MTLGIKYPVLLLLIGLGTACSQNGAEAQQTPVPVDKADINPNWSVDKSTSSISFAGSMNGEAFTGHFADFDAQIEFDHEKLESAKISVSVAMVGADAGDEERTEALPGKEWFAVKTYPYAEFHASTVKKTGENLYEAVGDLTIKGTTNPLTLPFSLDIKNKSALAKGQFSLNRRDFKVGTGMWKNEDWVDHKVDVKIAISAHQK